MSSIADSAVTIQTSAQSVPSTPSWFGEVVLIAHYLKQQGVLAALEGRVRFARRRFGQYDLIDFIAVLLSQWMWNLRLELGHRLYPTPMRTTEFAPAQVPSDPVPRPSEPAPVTYGPPQWARQSYTKGFAGADFSFQPDGTLRCPAGQPLYAQERRPERNGSLRVLYAARIGHCRSCPLREHCQEKGAATIKPRRVSAVLWPLDGAPPEPAVPPALPPASHAILWGDWSRCQTRREWMTLLRTQTVTITDLPAAPFAETAQRHPLTRRQRAHWRLSWAERLARNARARTAPGVEITLFGLPSPFAAFLGLSTL
jgi:hypothetical protein